MSDEERDISREPWLAVILSRLFLGAGQIYSGHIIRGILLILLEVLLSLISLWFIFSPKGNIIIGISLMLLLGVIGIWNLFDAHRCARLKNSIEFEALRKANKDPWLSVFLSFLIPGLGQFYIKKKFWGILFIIISLIVFLFEKSYLIFFISFEAVFISLACYHAYCFSPIRRDRNKIIIVAISVAILCSGLLDYSGLVIKEYFIESFRICSNSMSPTLISQDKVLVQKYDKDKIKRGDVVIIKWPADPNILDAVRLIGFENETVEIRNAKVYINSIITHVSSINNIEYESVGNGPEANTFKVPEGHFFVLCDNSEKGIDSRYYGSVPDSYLIGRAYKIFWPPKRICIIE